MRCPMRRAAGQDEAAGGQRRCVDASADGREALAQARDAAAVAVLVCLARDAVVGHPHDDVVTFALDRDLAALGAGVAQQVRRPLAHERAEQRLQRDRHGLRCPLDRRLDARRLEDPDRVGELDGEPDAPVALDQLARLAQRLERQRVASPAWRRASSSSTPISRAASCALSAIACSWWPWMSCRSPAKRSRSRSTATSPAWARASSSRIVTSQIHTWATQNSA